MKTDKGLLLQDGIAWAAKASIKFQALKLPVYLSVNETQRTAYTSLIRDEILLFDDPDLKVNGPLKGLLSAHIRFPNDAIFLLACDLPDISEQMLIRLLHEFNQASIPPAICYSINGQPEPMCSIFQPETVRKIYDRAMQDKLEKFSMRYVLDSIGSHYIELAVADQPLFKNYNSPADL